MAVLELDDQQPEAPMTGRKRKRKQPSRRLLLHERVEVVMPPPVCQLSFPIGFGILGDVFVRSEDDGFLGSWHSGTVIACDDQGNRHVKYDHLLVDDCSDSLVEVVTVSSILDDIDSGCETWSGYRGNIRPLQPWVECGKCGLHYGLCVDVYYQEAWWEGVVFDHDDGSDERKIFFPDLGDEMKIGIDTLRITHNWDEVTENWQRRGTWILLELIEQYEQEKYLAVSVKQIWYDVRGKEGFEKIGEWTNNMSDSWEELVLEVIDDNLNITVKELFHVLELSGGLLPENLVALESTQPSTDVNMDPEKENFESCAKPVDNDSNSYGLIGHEANEKNVLNCSAGCIYEPVETCDLATDPNFSSLETCKDKLISMVESDGPNINLMTDLTISDQEKTMCVLPLALAASPSNFDGISCAASAIDGEGVPDDNVKNPKGSTCRSRVRWEPVSSKKLPGVEFGLHAVDQYCTLCLRKPSDSKLWSSIRTDVWEHLSYLGWKIQYVRDHYHKKLRYRYTSPVGTVYYSLYQACKHLKSTGDLVSSISQDDQKVLMLHLITNYQLQYYLSNHKRGRIHFFVTRQWCLQIPV
ncbi:hypothetical protein FNV43_RR15139 [Rhamnella rubrinervis]|uniref:Agenet domain-containing protein n=1 Tax=Rhamnella rubrinervis TaxID=2594499 RepID=A0A8K0E6R4_9ROSA|nr:hypothetical protein FNV43_RR15139 [Rhamnella rubrinervis]